MAEKYFDEVIEEIYEKEFIDSIFEPYSSLIDKQKFVEAIDETSGSMLGNIDLNPFDGEEPAEKGRCKWLFNPSEIRIKF